MTRYLPIAVGVLLIVGLTIIQVRMTDRLSGANVTAEQRAELLKNIPMNIGDWHGTDMPIDEAVRQTAGAVGAVSRQFRNVRTNEVVDLWLIVGHGRAISAHTPDICYRSSGFAARARENSLYPMEMDGGTQVPFLTNTFFREDITGRRLIRVFWTWFNTEDEKHEGKVVWEAPSNARWYFGNTRALYKMYFTSQMRDNMETSEQSPCLRFAREFIPVVDKALSQVYGGGAKAGDTVKDAGAASDTTASDTEPKGAAETEEAPAEEPAEPAALTTEEASSAK
ncbi:MAG: EpsI family protein [Planctomycetes bacterium]|nr:EpsI family protein [Planctomycetota bacterium]